MTIENDGDGPAYRRGGGPRRRGGGRRSKRSSRWGCSYGFSGVIRATSPFQYARAFDSLKMIWRAPSFDFRRLRNFSRFDLFASFHILVNCWSLSGIRSPTQPQDEPGPWVEER